MDMAAAARDIAGGDWSRTVPARGSAEATTLCCPTGCDEGAAHAARPSKAPTTIVLRDELMIFGRVGDKVYPTGMVTVPRALN